MKSAFKLRMASKFCRLSLPYSLVVLLLLIALLLFAITLSFGNLASSWRGKKLHYISYFTINIFSIRCSRYCNSHSGQCLSWWWTSRWKLCTCGSRLGCGRQLHNIRHELTRSRWISAQQQRLLVLASWSHWEWFHLLCHRLHLCMASHSNFVQDE